MARHLKMRVDDAHDERSIVIPDVKNGNIAAASQVLDGLGVKTNNHWDANGRPVWGIAERHEDNVQLTKVKFADNVTPDVTGMGAKDAVYLLESRGLRVRLHGRGKVMRQSYPAGKTVVKGSECVLTLD